MGELRWILLGLGALFLAGLALWEMRRPRHSARRGDALDPADGTALRDAPVMRAGDEGAFDLPEIRAADLRRDPPIVVLDDMRASDADESVHVAPEVAVDRPGAVAAGAVASTAGAGMGTPPEADRLADPPAEPQADPVAIQWPPAVQTRILWLRVMPLAQGRFAGRQLRQAVTSCGLVLGPQDIFHWADDAGRVIASVANLVRPGNFDPATLDAQQYPGLHLFSVLPGPLAPLHTLEELLGLARELAGRLQGVVQDERGQPLDAARLEALRDSLRESPAVDAEADGADA
jgi:hypothetical protein